MMKEDDEAKAILQRLMENLGEASGVLLDLREYLEISERRAQRVIKRLIRAAVVLVVGYLIVLILTGDAIRDAQREANNAKMATESSNRSIKKNRLAIRVGCTLLRNAIIESGAAIPEKNNPTVETPQESLRKAYVREILEHMTPQERREAIKLAKNGGLLTIPDCDRIALHPEEVIKDLGESKSK